MFLNIIYIEDIIFVSNIKITLLNIFLYITDIEDLSLMDQLSLISLSLSLSLSVYLSISLLLLF